MTIDEIIMKRCDSCPPGVSQPCGECKIQITALKNLHQHNYVQDRHSQNMWICSKCGEKLLT